MSTALAENSRGETGAATWLAAALVVLPFLQVLPIDFDRTGTLVLVLPALWAGRRQLADATCSICSSRWLRVLFGLLAASVAVSVALSDYPAPAAVTAAQWVVLVAAGLIAGQSVRTEACAGRRILAGLVIGAAAGTIVVWLWWLAEGRGGMPMYAHHRHLGFQTLPAAAASTALLIDALRRRGAWWVWLVLGTICWAGLLWSGGRGPVLALGVSLVAWFALRKMDRRAIAIAAGVQLIGGLALSAAFWTSRPELGWWHAFERTEAAVRAESVTELTSTRSQGWHETFERTTARPWVGHGPDSYRFLTPKLDGEQAHNVVLQLWLDLGWIGGSLGVVLLATIATRGWRCARVAESDLLLVGWATIFAAMLIEGCLDGVFYHLLAFLPTMLGAGIVMVAAAPVTSIRARWGALPQVATVAAVIVLTLHTAVFDALVVADPPTTPTGPMTRLLRAFPSTTFGLWRWIDAWQTQWPEQALAWDRWAEAHGSNPPLFHVRAAQLLFSRGDRQGAFAELDAAAAKAHWTVRPTILRIRQQMEAAPR